MVPMAFLSEGETAVIVDIHGGRNVITRLTSLGLTIGTRVRVIKSIGPGPILVEVRGSRLALGRGIAMKIIVEEG